MRALLLSSLPLGFLLAVACSTTTPAPAPVATSGSTTTPAPASSAPPDEDSPKFRACTVDTDCVAVDRVGCCHNGRKVAVAVNEQNAYAASFTCDKTRPICPEYHINDNRIPYCDGASHTCSMKLP